MVPEEFSPRYTLGLQGCTLGSQEYCCTPVPEGTFLGCTLLCSDAPWCFSGRCSVRAPRLWGSAQLRECIPFCLREGRNRCLQLAHTSTNLWARVCGSFICKPLSSCCCFWLSQYASPGEILGQENITRNGARVWRRGFHLRLVQKTITTTNKQTHKGSFQLFQ